MTAADVTMDEALDIAKEVDPDAGLYFHKCMVKATLMGAERQREKDGGGIPTEQEARDAYARERRNT